MVLVNDQKYACANCIQGHRSSSCAHLERPLYEIKKKGRPVSQCERCRERRKIRKLHVKCICDDKPEIQAPVPWPTGRKTAPRRIPSVPTFPNGVKDLGIEGMQIELPTGSQRHRAQPRPSQSGETHSSDGSTSSSLSSPAMSPQMSWNSRLSPLPGDSKMSYHAPQASAPLYFPPRVDAGSPGSSYGSASPPTSAMADRGGYFRPSNQDSPSYLTPLSTPSASPMIRPLSDIGRGPSSSPQSPASSVVAPTAQSYSTSRPSFTKDLIARSAASVPPPPPQSRSYGGSISSFSLNSSSTLGYMSTAHQSNLKAARMRHSPLSCSGSRCTCPGGACRNASGR